MLSAIASFFWGSSSSAAADSPSEPHISSSSSIKDDVVHDVITDDGTDDVSPALETTVLSTSSLSDVSPALEVTVLSTSSLSDEESGWVFVNNKQEVNADSSASEKDTESIETDPPVEQKDRSTNNVPVPRSRNIPSSALHASSVLNSLAELRPQHKSERRQKELRLKHKQLERSNKVVRVRSSSNRPNRRRSMYSPNVSSRAVNNRKC